jgi:hypothetical protein
MLKSALSEFHLIPAPIITTRAVPKTSKWSAEGAR